MSNFFGFQGGTENPSHKQNKNSIFSKISSAVGQLGQHKVEKVVFFGDFFYLLKKYILFIIQESTTIEITDLLKIFFSDHHTRTRRQLYFKIFFCFINLAHFKTSYYSFFYDFFSYHNILPISFYYTTLRKWAIFNLTINWYTYFL